MDGIGPLSPNLLALAGSPYQWAFVALVVVAIFAPRLLPPLARIIGIEARRRLGLPQMESRHPEQQPTVVEIIPPRPTIAARELEYSQSEFRQNNSHTRYWMIGGFVTFVLTMLLWFLLRSR